MLFKGLAKRKLLTLRADNAEIRVIPRLTQRFHLEVRPVLKQLSIKSVCIVNVEVARTDSVVPRARPISKSLTASRSITPKSMLLIINGESKYSTIISNTGSDIGERQFRHDFSSACGDVD
jgi:hypothetical protein